MTNPEIAGPFRRIGGFLVEGLFASAVNFLLLVPLALPLLVCIALWSVYEVGCVARWGRNFGKLAMGTRVVSAEDWWSLPGWGSAAVRWGVVAATGLVAELLLPLGLLLQAVVFGAIVVDELARGLHDRAAGTVVIVD